MVKSSIANIVGPAISSDNPDTLAYQRIGQTQQMVDASILRSASSILTAAGVA